jgi:hypothetical protein
MANKLSDKLGSTTVTSNPQSAQKAGTISQTLEDASAWVLLDGAKQSKGYAYADGSTLDNSSGAYNDYLAAKGDLVLPNGPFRTKEVDNSVCTVTNTNSSLTNAFTKAIAYTDSEGNWRLKANIRMSSATDTGTGVTLEVAGVVFFANGSSSGEQAVLADATTQSGNSWSDKISRQRAVENTNQIQIIFTSGGTNRLSVQFDVALESKPTWADANLESYPIVALNNNNANVISTKNLNVSGDVTVSGVINGGEATADQAGTVKKDVWGQINLVDDVSSGVTNIATDTTAGNEGFTFTGLVIGEMYQLKMNAEIQIEGNSSTEVGLMYAQQNGISILENYHRDDAGSTDRRINQSTSVVDFIATATNVTFGMSITGSVILVADTASGNKSTWCQLRKLENVENVDRGSDLSTTP